jgi:hypothetical protein
MFKLSEEFFTSLNLSAMPETFWERSILQKPEDRELVCHASAWDFYDGKDFRYLTLIYCNIQNVPECHMSTGTELCKKLK